MIFATAGDAAAAVGGAAGRRRANDRAATSSGSSNRERPTAATPVVWGQSLFLVTNDGIARCLDIHTGRLRWKARLKGEYRASPVAAEGRIYFLNTKGLCTVLSASPRLTA